MNIRQLSTTAVIAALVSLAGLGNHAQAHDTDVYLNPGGGSGGEPMVMFMLDWNPSLGSTAYSTLPTDPENGVRKLYDAGYLTKDTNIEAFDVFVAVLKQVLDPLHGVKVGVMISHNEKPSCKDYGPAAEGVCSRGAYMLAGLESVTAGDDDQTIAEAGYVGEDAHKKMIFEKLDAMPAPSGNTSHPFQGISLYFELFRYLTGQGIWNAHNGQTDYDTTDAENLDANIDISSDTGLDIDGDNTQALLMWDTGIEDVAPNKGKYISPLDIAAGHCSKIYVVNLIKDYGGENVKPWSDTINAAKNVGGMTTAVNVQSNAGWVNMIDWLHSVDLADGTWGRATELEGKQNITSYFVAKNTGQLTGAAEAGGTGVPIGFTTDKPGELRDKLNALFGQILSVSTSYTAPSVAVNVYNRAQVESDVFLAMFRAEETPLWPGNVKKFELGDLDFSYVDADGETITETVTTLLDNSNPQRDAVNHLDGRIDKDALSFWTIAGDLPDPVGEDEFEPGKDGRFVERGGCGSRIPGFKLTASYNPGFSNGGETTEIGPRKLFTQPLTVPTDGVPVALRALNAVDTIESDILTALGPMIAGTGAGDCTTPYVDTSGDGSEPDDITGCGMLRYARGINDDGSNRSWMFADALHSRPLAVNYGNEGDHNDADHPNIRIFVGSNDGYMHMIRNTTAAGVEEGIEGWAFMPKETMGILLDFKTSPTAPHPYGVDGAPTAYMIDTDGDGNIESGDGDRVILYFGLRRGGRAYYALDVTDPDDPKMLWQITGGIADTAFEELGQSWSTPKIGRMYVDGIVDDVLQDPIPVVFFAGGYDENKDTHSDPQHPFATGGNDSMGRAVFIVDALSGEPLWIAQYGASTSTGGSTATTFIGDNRTVPVFSHADMVDSIPSDVTPVDSDNNGLIDRIYVGDTGGSCGASTPAASSPPTWSLGPCRPVTGRSRRSCPWAVITRTRAITTTIPATAASSMPRIMCRRARCAMTAPGLPTTPSLSAPATAPTR